MVKTIAFLSAVLITGNVAVAQEGPAPFYQGKTITLVVGTEAGGPYDTYGRLFSRHVSKHLPGRPSVIVTNMPGAGSETAAYYVARVAPKDGTVIAATFASQPLNPILSDIAGDYDYRKLHYLGSAASETSVCLVRAGAPTTKFDEMFKTQVVMGGAAANTASGYQPVILNNLIGTKFKIVQGYPGTPNISHAIAKGEIDGQCGLGWLAMKSQYAQQVANREILPVAQLSEKGHPELNAMGIPKVFDYAKDERARGIMRIVYSQQVFARPYFVAAEVPAGRVALLRKAFMETWIDPELRAEADKMKLEVAPVSSTDMEALLDRLYATPPELAKAARAAVSAKSAQ
jgi:tripartite-type tricarboxylate transporter receptor subunit TctC